MSMQEKFSKKTILLHTSDSVSEIFKIFLISGVLEMVDNEKWRKIKL